MLRRPPRSTRTDTLFPYTTLFRSAYATDPLARRYATRAVDAGFDTQVDPALRVFVYLPFEHSEDMADQLRCIELTRAIDPEYMKYAVAHKEVIERFGRFPHRNRELGRETKPDEEARLDAGREEQRRVGTECVGTLRSWWSPKPQKKKKHN